MRKEKRFIFILLSSILLIHFTTKFYFVDKDFKDSTFKSVGLLSLPKNHPLCVCVFFSTLSWSCKYVNLRKSKQSSVLVHFRLCFTLKYFLWLIVSNKLASYVFDLKKNLFHSLKSRCVSVLLVVVSILTAVGAWAWLWDPRTSEVCFHSFLCTRVPESKVVLKVVCN